MYETHCNREMGDHLGKQDAAHQRDVLMDGRIDELTRKGGDCYPWTTENFQEAIENAPSAEQRVMFVTVLSAVLNGLDNNHSNHLALTSISSLVNNYWMKCAAVKAEKEMQNG